MKKEVVKFLKNWLFTIAKMTVIMAFLWPLMMIMIGIMLSFSGHFKNLETDFFNFYVLVHNIVKGALVGFFLGFGLGSFDLIFLYNKNKK